MGYKAGTGQKQEHKPVQPYVGTFSVRLQQQGTCNRYPVGVAIRVGHTHMSRVPAV